MRVSRYRSTMPTRLVAVSFEVRDPDVVAAFWAGLLGREVVAEQGGALVPGDNTQVGLRFVAADTEEKTGPNRLHLHLTSTDLDDQQQIVERVIELGGRIIRPRSDEYEEFVMADPGRNEFCVIEPGNNFLAGAGFLAEVTCEGAPEVGYFWRDALGWTLVWDRGEQTAIQSPLGGTKVSWDVSPNPNYGSKRQRFDLVASGAAEEVARLVTLGAAVLSEGDDVVLLTDPGGNEFSILLVD